MGEIGDLFEPVKKNEKYGFYELADKYRKQMQDFYSDEYYQNEHALYQKKAYDEIDMKHKRFFFAQKQFIYEKNASDASEKRFLDIGCGEGYALAYFNEQGWDVTGIDYSSFGVENHNPEMAERLIKGDFDKIALDLERAGKKFELINADNLLEHLPNPESFFENVKKISHPGTIVSVLVPNDFSRIQKLAYKFGNIDGPFWVTTQTSEHFNYFSIESLTALGEGFGLEKVAALGDWSIDYFLLHGKTNYKVDKTAGHDCHVACTELENSIYEDSMEDAVGLFEALGKVGIGRNISVYFRVK